MKFYTRHLLVLMCPYFVSVPFAELTHSFCFATCSSGLTNSAPGADNSVPPTLGSFSCDDGNGLTTGNSFASQWITISPSIQTAGPKTVAILLKHTSGSDGRTPREFRNGNTFILNSEPFPHARAEINGNGGLCRMTVNDVFSTTEYVLVVITVDGTALKMYKNGVESGSAACSHTVGTDASPLWLGANHLGGTIKSFALWDRALSGAEIAGLDSSKLTCNAIPMTTTVPTPTTTIAPPVVFDGLRRSKLTHGWWDATHWTYRGPNCGSGEEVFSTVKTNPNSETAYLDTCFGYMPKQFLVYDFEEAVTLTKYSWSGRGGECPSSWTVYGANIYPDVGTDMTLVDTETSHSCQASEQMIDFEMDDVSGEYRYYVWKLSEMDLGNGNNDGYRWYTIQLFIGQGK